MLAINYCHFHMILTSLICMYSSTLQLCSLCEYRSCGTVEFHFICSLITTVFKSPRLTMLRSDLVAILESSCPIAWKLLCGFVQLNF